MHIKFDDDLTKDLVVLDMKWLLMAFKTVTGFKSCDVGQFNISDLHQQWSSFLFGASHLYGDLLWLLERYEVLFKIDDQRLFAPCLLDAESTNRSKFWPQRLEADKTQLVRAYYFDFLPLGFGGRFMGAVLSSSSGWSALAGWKNGMIFGLKEEVLLVEINPSQHCLRINIRYPSIKQNSETLGPLVESLSTLIRNSLHSSVRIEVPCLHCLKMGSYDPYIFNLEDLSKQMADGDYFAYCRSIYPVRIFSMAPEISVEGIDSHVIPYSSIEMGEQLGEGSFSTVFKGKWNNEEVAIKLMNVDDKMDVELKRKIFSEWRREVETMRILVHPNIVAMKGICVEPLLMVLDLCNIDLYHYLSDESRAMNWKLRLQFAYDVAKGMEFLHSVTPPIIHRDLKSPNVLVKELDQGRFTAKIADFGLSVRFGLTSALVGAEVENPYWTAPEVQKNEQYTEKCDVYSYGIILWELLTRKEVFGEVRWISEVEKMVQRGDRPEIPAECPRPYEVLVQKCWSGTASERPSFSQITALLSKISDMLGLDSLEKTSTENMEQLVAPTTATHQKMPRREVGVEMEGGIEEKNLVYSELPEKANKGGEEESKFSYEFWEVLDPQHHMAIECMYNYSGDGCNVLWSGDQDGFVQVTSICVVFGLFFFFFRNLNWLFL